MSSSSLIFSPNSFDIFFKELKVIVSALGSSINKSNILLIPSLDSLSPNLSFIASTKSSNVIPPFLSASGVSNSEMSWNIVGFMLSNPRDCVVALSSLGLFYRWQRISGSWAKDSWYDSLLRNCWLLLEYKLWKGFESTIDFVRIF